jgi:hypothetical protein
MKNPANVRNPLKARRRKEGDASRSGSKMFLRSAQNEVQKESDDKEDELSSS